MAQTGYTPISIYYSSTASNTPTAGNLVAGELAINTADGKLFYKDSSGVVQVIAGKGGAGVAGGSTTQVQYNSSGSLAGSANFIFDGTNVGIGISTPSSYSKLSVLGAVTSGEQSSPAGSTLLRGYYPVGALTVIGTEFSSGGPVIGYGVTGSKSAEGSFESTTTANLPRSAFYMDGGNFRFYSAVSQTTAIGSTATGMTEYMRLDSSGNLLVGTTSASYGSSGRGDLEVNGSASSIIALKIGGGTTNASYLYNDSTNLEIAATGSRFLRFTTSSSEAMRIDSSGNVGIGTSSPEAKLHVVGKASAFPATSGTTQTGSSVRLQPSDTNAILDIGQNSSSGAWLQSTNRTNLALSYPLLINPNGGNVIVNATAINTVGSIDLIKSGNGSGSSGLIAFNASGTSNYPIIFRYNGSDVGYITYTNTIVSYVSLSDYRLKESIAPMLGALDKVAKLKPVTYKWKSDGSKGQGFIAHELAEVCPDAVTGEKDAVKTETYQISPEIEATFDEDGNELTKAVEAVMGEREVPAYQGVDTSFLVATLTAAIQELTAKVIALEAKVG
jgi:hypothetical protein